MAVRSSKAQQGAVTTLNLAFNGGLNLSQAPSNIADNELVRATNFLYNPQTGTPETRPGTRCQTAAVCDGTNPILKIYYYEKSSSQAWLVAVCNGNLYYLSGGSLNAWTKIGALTNTTTVPQFLTYHSKLLIADGGQNIRTWDGTTYTTLSDGLYATAITVIKGRVVVNSTAAGSNDLVTFSGAEDETMWDTSDGTNPAIALRAGYGDNMSVNAFAVFVDDLIVSKKGDAEKKKYRINTSSATESEWYVKILTENNCSQSAHTIVSAFNNVFFADTNGFKSLSGVTEYGDIQVDMLGAKVNNLFSSSSTCDEVYYMPYYSAIWFIISERVYCYHRVVDVSGNVINAFTDLYFQQGRIRSVCQAGSTIYLAGNNGYLYTLDTTNTYSTDETSPSVTASYTSAIKSKQFVYFGGAILRRCEIYLKPLKSGTATLTATTPETDTITLKSITLKNSGEYLYDATGYLYAADDYLYDMGILAWYEVSHNRVRGDAIQFQLASSSGRVGVEGLKAEIAMVEGA
jgi:hypothetical protein